MTATIDDESMTPAAVPTGTESYYRDRLADFARRWPGRDAPDYYAEYGDKCLHQFLKAEHTLTEPGQAWLRRTVKLLQGKMEHVLAADPRAFAALELDGDAFHDFAFSTHSEAYLEAGLLELPLDDLWKIVRTPDLTDLLTKDGIREITEVFEETSMHDLAGILKRTIIDRPDS